MEGDTMTSSKKMEIDESVLSGKSMSTVEQLAEVATLRAALRQKLKDEKAAASLSRKTARLQRNDVLAEERATLDEIVAEIQAYNRLGKAAKMKCGILGRISTTIMHSDSVFIDA